MFGIEIGKLFASFAVAASIALGWGHDMFDFFAGIDSSTDTHSSVTIQPAAVNDENLAAPSSASTNVKANASPDAALMADLNVIDVHMGNATKASTDIEQSFNDRPIEQAQ